MLSTSTVRHRIDTADISHAAVRFRLRAETRALMMIGTPRLRSANVDINDISAHISGTYNGVSAVIKAKSASVYTNKDGRTNKIYPCCWFIRRFSLMSTKLESKNPHVIEIK